MPGRIFRWIKANFDSRRLERFFDGQADPWESMPFDVEPCSFGLASVHEFSTYLEGRSAVAVASLDDLCGWLRECEAVDDFTLFRRADHWQHPVSFEQLRRGDCEDHALWAWRKLRELGLPTSFMAGVWGSTAHAWTLFNFQRVSYLLEATSKRDPLFQPIDAVRHQYCPALAIDEHLRTHVYQGYPRFLALAETTSSQPRPRSDSPS